MAEPKLGPRQADSRTCAHNLYTILKLSHHDWIRVISWIQGRVNIRKPIIISH